VLDGLPLALATAGAYLNQVSTSLTEYLRLYNESWLKLQKSTPELISYEDRMLYSTWQISYDHIQRQNILSAKLLQLWAYLDNRDVWRELLEHTHEGDPDWILEITEDELSFNAAIRVLCDHGLVEADTSSSKLIESRGYSMHGCVHAWTIHVLNQNWDREMARLALKFVSQHVTVDGVLVLWAVQTRLLPHANRCLDMIEKNLVPAKGTGKMMHGLADLYTSQRKLGEAEKMYYRALIEMEKSFGPDHTITLDVVNDIGGLYQEQHRLEDAEKMYLRALQGRQKAQVSEDLMVTEFNNLGSVYAMQGKLDEAENMLSQALAGYEKASGPDAAETLNTVGNLGNVYVSQGRLEEAELMMLRALAGHEKLFGEDHIITLRAVENLGLFYASQNEHRMAVQAFRRTLIGKEKALGPDHLETIDTVQDLGIAYDNSGMLEKAEQMYLQALKGYEKALDSQQILTSVAALGLMYIFASLLSKTGKFDEAKSLLTRALPGFEKVYGRTDSKYKNAVAALSRLSTDDE
jgi:tetratricopeptide (TPR) repeat protein